MKTAFLIIMTLALCVGCRPVPEHEHHGRAVFSYQGKDALVTEPIRNAYYYVQQGREGYLVLPLDDNDVKSISELISGHSEIIVSLYLGERFYDDLRIVGGESITSLILHYPRQDRVRYWDVVKNSGIKVRGLPKP